MPSWTSAIARGWRTCVADLDRGAAGDHELERVLRPHDAPMPMTGILTARAA